MTLSRSSDPPSQTAEAAREWWEPSASPTEAEEVSGCLAGVPRGPSMLGSETLGGSGRQVETYRRPLEQQSTTEVVARRLSP